MEKVKQYKRKLNMSGSGFYRKENPTTNITFQLDDNEMSLLGKYNHYLKVNPFLTLELNKRLHQNKDLSINQDTKEKDNRFRFVVIDTQKNGYGIQPKDLNIDSNYNHKHYTDKFDGLPSYWCEEDSFYYTDDYDEDFKKMEEINEREVK